MNKKKVLILITKSNWGGAQRYVFDISSNLNKENFDIEVMAGSQGELINRLNQAGIKASGNLKLGRDIDIMSDISGFFDLLKILNEKRPDILHLNSSKISGLGALAGRISGIKNIIFTSHGWAFNENRNTVSKIIIKFLHWLTIILSHKTIAVSHGLMKQVINLPFVSNKIIVIHNATNNIDLLNKNEAINELKNINSEFNTKISDYNESNTLLLGSVGELHHVKGYEYSLKSVSELINSDKFKQLNKKVVYLIFGEGEERKNIQNLINELNIQENVILFGHVKNASKYFKAFDIFILPSISESFGYVLLESGLASLPCIASNVGGIPEIIQDKVNGILVQSNNVQDITSAIQYYLQNPQDMKIFGARLNDKVRKDFSLDNMIYKTSEIYNTVS
jgi:glycosyltransferase involved in cell wall biosynthesis